MKRKREQQQPQREEEVDEDTPENGIEDTFPLLELPDLVLAQVVSLVGIADAFALRMTNRRLCEFVISDSPIFADVFGIIRETVKGWESRGE